MRFGSINNIIELLFLGSIDRSICLRSNDREVSRTDAGWKYHHLAWLGPEEEDSLVYTRRRSFHTHVCIVYCLVIKSIVGGGWIEWFRETGFTPGNTPKPDDDRSYFIRDLYPCGGCGWKRWMGWFWLVILIKPKNSGGGQEWARVCGLLQSQGYNNSLWILLLLVIGWGEDGE